MEWKLNYDMVLCVAASVDDLPTLSSITLTCRELRRGVLPILHEMALTQDDIQVRPVDPDATEFTSLHGINQHRPYAVPLVLWAAAVPDLPLLETVLARRKHHLSARFRHPPRTCQPHWQWKSHPSVVVTSGIVTPLHVAAERGHVSVIRWLLRHLTTNRPEVLDAPGSYVCTCPSAHLRVLREIHVISEPEGAPHASPLHLALCHGHQDCARLLITHGASWSKSVPGSCGVTGLMIMAANGQLALLDWLIDRRLLNDIALLQRDHMCLTPLNYASVCRGGWVAKAIVKRLQPARSSLDDFHTCDNSLHSDSSDCGIHDDTSFHSREAWSDNLESCPVFTARCMANSDVVDQLCQTSPPNYHTLCLDVADWQMENGER